MFRRHFIAIAVVAVGLSVPAIGAEERKPPARVPKPQPPIQIQVQMGGFAGRVADVPNKTDERPDVTGLVLADRGMLLKLSRAEKLIDEKRFADALPFLQSLLESPQDAAVPSDAVDRSLLRSMKLEAQRLIGSLPADGRRMYEAKYGGMALRMLEEARKNGDLELVSETARRYFHTEAGYEAMHLLGAAHLDHDRPLAAALCFQRLREIPEAARKRRTMLALKTAVCWSRAGMPEHAQNVLDELKDANPRGVIRLAGRNIGLFEDKSQALDWLAENFSLDRTVRPRDVGDWPVVGGNASRTAIANARGPAAEPLWTVSTCAWKVPVEEAPFSGGLVDVSRQIEAIEADFLKRDQSAVPASVPLVVDGLVLVRTVDKLKALDLTGGQLAWETPGDTALEGVRRGTVPPVPGNRGSILDPLLEQRVFTDSTYGTLSSDGRLVFCLEKLGFVSAGSGSSIGRRQPHPLAAKEVNRLDAYDLHSGKRKWQVSPGANDTEQERAKHFFLGPPLPLSRSLYCLTDTNGEICLLVLDSQTGDRRWMQSLESAEIDITIDPHRRQSGLSPSYAGGVLVCPTGCGSVVAVDLAMRTLMWRYRYRKYEGDNPNNRRRAVLIAMAGRRLGGTAPAKPEGRWLDPLACISGGHVILSPRDSQELHCLKLLDGTLLWKQPREGRLYVGGVSGDRLLIVGNEQIEMLRIGDGKPVWTQSIPMPSGRGFRAGGCYHLPLATASMMTFDLDSGRVLSTSKSAAGYVPGNFVCSGGYVISQGTDSLAVFRQLESPQSD